MTLGAALESKYVWLVTPSWNRLHYVPEADDGRGAESGWAWWENASTEGFAEAKAICGVRAAFALPGILSRMGCPRCKTCCRMLGIPYGGGAPVNEESMKTASA